MLRRVPLIMAIILGVSLFSSGNSGAEGNKGKGRVYLKNGDVLTGEIISQDPGRLRLLTEVAGELWIRREFIQRIDVKDASGRSVEEKENTVLWKREVSSGYTRSRGNTDSDQLAIRLLVNRKTPDNEFTVKGNSFYSASKSKMDAQKWAGMLRYAFSFSQRKWYNFYKVEGDHNRFADINYRLVPAGGLGYWFFDTTDHKVMAEVGIGVEHTDFRSGAKSTDEMIVVPRMFLEKRIFASSRLSQEVILYPSFKGSGRYRLRSETVFSNPISDKLSLRISFLDEYNSEALGNAKRNDTRLISGLNYSF